MIFAFCFFVFCCYSHCNLPDHHFLALHFLNCITLNIILVSGELPLTVIGNNLKIILLPQNILFTLDCTCNYSKISCLCQHEIMICSYTFI